MAYDGMYSDLSTRSSTNEILQEVIQNNTEAQAAATAAGISAANASTSELNSLISETNSAAAADISTDQAAEAVVSASNAATSAAEAVVSADAAEDSATAAAASASAAAASAAASDLSADDAAASAAAAIAANNIVVVSSLAALRARDKNSPVKVVTVVDTTLRIYGNYRIDTGAVFVVDNGGDQIIGTDGGKWVRISNTNSTNVLYRENGAITERFADRVFVGGAVKHNGTNSGVQPDWLTTKLISYGRTFGFQHVTQNATLTDEAPQSCNAILGGGKTSNFTSLGNTIGVLGVGINDNASIVGVGAWGGYFEGFQEAAAQGPCYSAEFDTINFGTANDTTPYTQHAKQVVAVQIAAGAEFAGTTSSSAAINIQNNGANYLRGIVFGYHSIAGADGTNGIAEVMSFGKGHSMQWWAAAGKTSSILCEGTTVAAGIKMRFADNQMQLRNQNDKIVFQAFSDNAHVNYPSLRSSGTNNAVQFLASGDDTNIDIQLFPKGSGALRYGTFTAGAVTNNGYITIRTEDGTLRKVMLAA